MEAFNGVARVPRAILEVVTGYLALHGAFNLNSRTEPEASLRVFAVVAGIALIVAVVGSRLIARGGSAPRSD